MYGVGLTCYRCTAVVGAVERQLPKVVVAGDGGDTVGLVEIGRAHV